jgi:8-oxo-dGTP diphosphatase
MSQSSLPLMSLCFLVRTAPDGRRTVLLGLKKRGFGEGNVVGLGGKVESYESAREAAAREAAEESGVAVEPVDLEEMARISFWFPTRPSWNQQAAVFVADRWQGEPAESDEIVPAWHPVDALPFDAMWADARHWLPVVLHGVRVTADFTFAPDCRTIAAYDVRTRP